MLTRILRILSMYGVQIKGGTIHQFLRDAKWVYMGTEKQCPVYYLFLTGPKYQNKYNKKGVNIGHYLGPRENKPDIVIGEIDSYITNVTY